MALIPLWAATTLAGIVGFGAGTLVVPALQRRRMGSRSTPDVAESRPADPAAGPHAEAIRTLEAQREAQDRTLRSLEESLVCAQNDHLAERETLTRARDALLVEREQMDLKLQEQRECAAQQTALAEQYRERLASLQEREAVCAAVRADLGGLPSELREFATGLLTLEDVLSASDAFERLTLPDTIDLLDRYVYRSLPPPGRVTALPGRDLHSEDLLRLVSLQALIHERLRQFGLSPIQPSPGDPYDVELHACGDEDLVWINDAPERHNRVAALKRIGYRSRDRVLRKAEVRRFLFLESEARPAMPASGTPPSAEVRPVLEAPSSPSGASPPGSKAVSSSLASDDSPIDIPALAVLQEPVRGVSGSAAGLPAPSQDPAPSEPGVGRVSAASLLSSEHPEPL